MATGGIRSDKHDDPLIEFYDMDSGAAAIMRNSGDKTEAYLAEEYGQFVSRYYYSTLKMRDPLGEGSALTDWSKRGLNLDGGVDRWSVSSEFMVDAMAAINQEMEERAELERRETGKCVMVTRKELMEWLNTCPDHHWDIIHEDEGHMRVLFVFV